MLGDTHRSNLRSALIGAVVAAVVLLSFPAVAAVGSNLILGKPNTADAVTSLAGAATTNLRITNTQAGAAALDLRVVSGSAPLKVNSTTKVAKLNADLLDGKHGAAYALAGHLHTGSYLGVNDTAVNADSLDGQDSTEFASAVHAHPANAGPQTFFRTANAGEDVTIASQPGVVALVLHCTETRTTLRWHKLGFTAWYTGATLQDSTTIDVDIAYTEAAIQGGFAAGLGLAMDIYGNLMLVEEATLLLAHDNPTIISGTKACVAVGNVSLGRSLDGN